MSVELFLSIGLPAQRAEETLKNKQLTESLAAIIGRARRSSPTIDKSLGSMLYHVATKVKSQERIDFLLPYVLDRRVTSEPQINAAVQFLTANPSNIDRDQFEKSCGVGIVVTEADIQSAVDTVISANQSALVQQRYAFPIGQLLNDVRNQLKWADGKLIKTKVDAAILQLLGPKTDADSKAAAASKKAKPSKAPEVSGDSTKKSEAAMETNGVNFDQSDEKVDMFKSLSFHAVGENYTTQGYVINDDIMKRLEEHKKEVEGRVMTRFPPEPNGILHIGHAKAININFGYARAHQGRCYLRYDDTNPEKEEERYFTGIKDMVEWLGFTPYKITHSSDYFDTLYEYAVRLIKSGVAYVCHQKVEDLKGFEERAHSPWRERPVGENLQLFSDMRAGLFDEGEATLRLKYVMEDGKLDPVAYRIKFVPHHRTGNKWCIYPTYDFTHPLCDSIENITHSLCTKEFQSHRSMYYWLCNSVRVYCPVQWEYGRLNVNYTVVSKRKILKLISEGHVADWDDPRLFTLPALRRKGYPPAAVNDFVHRLGVTMATVTIDPEMLEFCVRNELNRTARRVMAVIDPLLVLITNFSSLTSATSFQVPDFPERPDEHLRSLSISQHIYIEQADFVETADKNFKRLATNQTVGLKYADLVLTVDEVFKSSSSEKIELLKCRAAVRDSTNKPKGYIQWVLPWGLECEFRLYQRLFLHKNPEDSNEVPGGFLSDINPNSLTTMTGVVDPRVAETRGAFEQFQFERIGYFARDPDSTEKKLIFNKTVGLREDSSKLI